MKFLFSVLTIALNIMQLLLLARAILSLLRAELPTGLVAFVFRATEPVVRPFRALTWRVRALRNMPIDPSPLAAFLAVTILAAICGRFA